MKHLQSFETTKYTRDVVYKYLDKSDSDKLEVITREFFSKIDFLEKIDKLNLSNFREANFSYRSIFDDFLVGKYYNDDKENPNIYYYIDRYCLEHDLYFSNPAQRNTLGGIIEKLYKEYSVKLRLKSKLDKKLISIFEREPERYEKRYNEWKDKLNPAVKKACDWMLNYKAYNL